MDLMRISVLLGVLLSNFNFVNSEESEYINVLIKAANIQRNIRDIKSSQENLLSGKRSTQAFISALNHNIVFAETSVELLSSTDTEICRNQTQSILNAFTNGEPWALKMIDAMGKPPPDLLSGNFKWYGSYDECTSIAEETHTNNYTQFIRGQYCSVYIPINNQPNALTGGSVDYLTYGVCFPDTCSDTDILSQINTFLRTIPLVNGSIAAERVLCQEQNVVYDSGAYAAIVIISVLLFLMVIGTGFDLVYVQWPYHRNNSETDLLNEKTPLMENRTQIKTPGTIGKLLQSFSIYTNGKKILCTEQGSESLSAINGIRFLSISWVVLGHSYIFALTIAANGTVFVSDMLSRLSFQAVNNALVSVDSFFAVSGLLLSYLILKELEKKQLRLNWFMFYFHRFWRLTPPYMLILMVSATLTRYFGSGPIWPKDGFEINQCKTTWMWNLLYINNFVKIEEMCMNWSWYLANDMQFFILSPLMLIPLASRYSMVGIIICMVFLLGTTVTAGVLSSVYNMPPSLFGGGGDPTKVVDYMKWYYFKPYCRMGPYIIGILTGYFLWKSKRNLKINKYLNLAIWCLAVILACAVLYGLRDPINDDPLSRDITALYNATHRSVWGACVCWVIFACATGNGGFVNTLLSWRPFIPLSRLSYCVYLVHPIVIYTQYFSLRRPLYFTDNNMIYFFLGHLVLSNMVAFVASLTFEAPMMGLEKVIFRRKGKN